LSSFVRPFYSDGLNELREVDSAISICIEDVVNWRKLLGCEEDANFLEEICELVLVKIAILVSIALLVKFKATLKRVEIFSRSS